MASISSGKKRIAILTGGGDVPGLNPAIRAVTIRALREGWDVIGLRRGWAGVMEIVRDHVLGRPILVGTISVEVSEHLSRMLKREGIIHSVLNAKYKSDRSHVVL